MKVFFSVGEPSGDLHGANLIRSLRRRHPSWQFVGYGGPRMAAAGCELQADLTEFAVMWFLRALLNLPRFWHLFYAADRCFRYQKPDAVVLIDYPGFNWWVARRAKAHRIPVFYYGAPQMWAWAGWRVRKMRRLVDHVLCKLPFEVEWYQERDCPATYVGHPYFDELSNRSIDHDFVAERLALQRPLVTILPGSRTQEVAANLRAFLQTAVRIQASVPGTRFAIAAFSPHQAVTCRRQLKEFPQLAMEVHTGRTAELIQAATACLACSGSVSLELLYHQKPSVIHYRISKTAYRIQRFFRKVRFITLANLLDSEDRYCTRGEVYDPRRDHVAFPEYLTYGDRSSDMAQHLVAWLTDSRAHEQAVRRIRSLHQQFAHAGASQRAAEYLSERLTVSEPPLRTHHVPGKAAA